MTATVESTHLLKVSDPVVAKFPSYRGNSDNPWFAGTIAAFKPGRDRCSVKFCDGDWSDDVKTEEVRYAPERPEQWGKGSMRGVDLIPEGASKVRFPPIRSPHPLERGDLVVAKHPRGQELSAWLAGIAERVLESHCVVRFQDEELRDVEQDKVLCAPFRSADWESDGVPPDSVAVTFISLAPDAHALRVGELVVAKFPPYRGHDCDPWFAGTVSAINADERTCSVQFEDGDFGGNVRQEEVLYAPRRPDSWGKGGLRGNDMIPEGALAVDLAPPKLTVTLTATRDGEVALVVRCLSLGGSELVALTAEPSERMDALRATLSERLGVREDLAIFVFSNGALLNDLLASTPGLTAGVAFASD